MTVSDLFAKLSHYSPDARVEQQWNIALLNRVVRRPLDRPTQGGEAGDPSAGSPPPPFSAAGIERQRSSLVEWRIRYWHGWACIREQTVPIASAEEIPAMLQRLCSSILSGHRRQNH